MRIIRIEEKKKDKMSDYAEKMLKYGGKLMQCIEELGEDDYGDRDEDLDDEDWDDDDFGQRRSYRRESMGGSGSGGGGSMGQRRSRRTGRFIR